MNDLKLRHRFVNASASLEAFVDLLSDGLDSTDLTWAMVAEAHEAWLFIRSHPELAEGRMPEFYAAAQIVENYSLKFLPTAKSILR
jgi:hypothetical protein